VKALRLTQHVSFLLAATAALPASGASPAGTCQAELQRSASTAEDALRACAPVFQESGCQIAWTELLDAPRASPGYGRGASVLRLANACEKAYCRLAGISRHPLCTGKSPPPLTAEFFAAWRSFQTEIFHREHVSANSSERLVQALKLWAGFLPRPGTRTILQAVTRPDVAAVVALTLWNPQGERLGAWVTDVVPEASTLRALVGAVPPPKSGSASPCIRLEATGILPAASTEALLTALSTVCRVEMVTVPSV
jgi:hypothetical protein